MQDMHIEGGISVRAVLKTESRKIFRIIIDKNKHIKDKYIIETANKRNIKIDYVSEDELSTICDGKTHGGIAAFVGERNYVGFETLFDVDNPFIALIEGVEDPYNFGDSLRSLFAAGVSGLLLPCRNWFSAANIIVKSSAGASEFIPTAVTDDFENVLNAAKKRGIKVFCADRKDAVPMYEADFCQPMIIAIGGELRGLSTKITKNSDKNYYIPYGSEFRNSLSTSAAAAVLGFEVLRQRKQNGVFLAND